MIETFVALLLAHVVADFLLQPAAMASGKRRLGWLAGHGAIVALTSVAATGAIAPELAALTLAHMAIDAIKAHLRQGLGSFLGDQAAHLVVLAAFAWAFPGLWHGGLWAGLPGLSQAMTALAGAVIAVRAGQFAVGLLMDGLGKPEMEPGLASAGTVIGLLERGLVFTLILAGQPGGIGFLIAAKSVLRFGTVGSDRAVSEYVIIGTLASFGWALVVAYATLAGLALQPPLGI
ncbi:MAG: DUF3307 domain-containing protein, partial [Gemmobacter sp.]